MASTFRIWPLGKFKPGRGDGGGMGSASPKFGKLAENRGIAVAVHDAERWVCELDWMV